MISMLGMDWTDGWGKQLKAEGGGARGIGGEGSEGGGAIDGMEME